MSFATHPPPSPSPPPPPLSLPQPQSTSQSHNLTQQKPMGDVNKARFNVASSLRQLVSGFDSKSTFFYARASHEEFEVDQLMPATVFTICDLPHNQGYGSAANSSGKLSSKFLQVLAVSVINQSPVNFSSALDDFSNVKLIKESQSSTSLAWKRLSAFVDILTINTLANRHIKKDVQLRLKPCIVKEYTISIYRDLKAQKITKA